MPEEIQIIPTSDGSFTLLNKALDETYHSRHGAIQESVYVFINKGLEFIASQKSNIKVLEVGFGTGLNTLLTAQYAATHNLSIHYTTLEAFPVEENIWSQLNYVESEESKKLFEKLHRAKWNQVEPISSNFTLQKLHTSLQEVELENDYDLIYFDAFAPNKQPEMWELPMLQKIADCMKPGGVFITYCAKGQLKRDLKSARLTVESLQGPPGKREMVRAVKN